MIPGDPMEDFKKSGPFSDIFRRLAVIEKKLRELFTTSGAGIGAIPDHDHNGDAGDGGVFDAANLGSGASADGNVLTSDGAGGAAWEPCAGGAAVADLGSTAETIGGAHDDGTAATASRSDHKHEITMPDAADLYSDSAAEGQVLMANGTGGANWADIDGGSNLEGGNAPISLLHGDGANNSTDIIDEIAGITWAAQADAKLSTSTKKFGGSSLSLDGVDDYVLSTSISGTGVNEVTIECWLYPSSVVGTHGFFSTLKPAGEISLDEGICLSLVGDKVKLSIGSNRIGHVYTEVANLTSALAVTVNAWNHVVAQRDGNVWSLWIGGIKDANTTTYNANLTQNETCWGVCRLTGANSNSFFAGFIDEMMIYGDAKYAADFVPPSLPYVLPTHIERLTSIQFRGGPEANKPPLFQREPFLETDTGKLWVGDNFYNSGAANVADLGGGAEIVGGAHNDGVALTAARSDHIHEITNPKLDDLATPDNNTDLDSNTTNHGLLLKAVAPAAGLSTVPAIENGETVWKLKALFDSNNPESPGVAAPGTSLLAARRDHVHPAGAGDGDVVGPAGATDGHLAVFDGATGKAIKDGGAVPGGGGADFLVVQVFT